MCRRRCVARPNRPPARPRASERRTGVREWSRDVVLHTVSVQDCTVNANKANGTVLAEGGGIYSDATILTLTASNVKGNKASTAGDDIFIHP